MQRFLLGIGSNDNSAGVTAYQRCEQIIAELQQTFAVVVMSELINTVAVGNMAPDYVNGVVCVAANIDAVTLKQWCKQVEDKLGRVRKQPICTADIDILYQWQVGDSICVDTVLDSIGESWFRQLAIPLLTAMTE